MPKTFTATCPACKKALDVPSDKAGEKVECPECFEVFEAEKPDGPKIQVVLVHGAPPRKRGKKPAGRRRDEDEDDDTDYAPPAEPRPYYAIRPPGTTLTLGILSLVFVCVPILGIILSVVTLSGPSSDLYHPADRSTVRTGKMLAWSTLGLYAVAILTVAGYFSR